MRNMLELVLLDLARDLKRNSRVTQINVGSGVMVGRLEGFFKVLPKSPEELAKRKRKAESLAAEKKAAKKGKTGGGGAPGRKGGK